VAGVRTPGLAEVVGDAGLLVDRAGGIEALGEALATLLGDRELAAFIGARGPTRVAQLAPARGLQRLAARLRSG
jgi:glycosyltransferase involved in cell wall biosynthesis